MSKSRTIEVKNLDHLGIIAGLIDEIGIVDIINEKLGIDKREKISSLYKIKAKPERQEQEITAREKQAGRFILATNVLEQEVRNSAEILLNYKNQQSCEGGFRFLKDTDS
ncbi:MULTISPECIES: DUF4277 domain-containing protein [unclassified Coleofasciculus]|uniref:DUF4277 domain-containing protein n=1 Tax=Coleofasciculus sp. LEGE 07081 TaxID=2777967 RepID=UPI001D13991C|nr:MULTISPECIES: DUF4277 domain-containing protein [unclassified Coleofasciculus]